MVESGGRYVPPDGGWRAWTVLFSRSAPKHIIYDGNSGTKMLFISSLNFLVFSFLCNGIVFGIVNSSGKIFEALDEMYQEQGEDNAATKAALVGAMQIGATFALSPISGMLAGILKISNTG